ncbi:hypothetical protein K474DRAFT_852977 [Panus rudis PR-1116 ss-1]|nr:hypothetical protein K474DRAFT_852977 [Panus rudis PR-1116 ss-1]
MQIRLGLLPNVLLLTIFSRFVHAANFTFSFGNPSQCDNFPISWSGGQPPFQLTLTPIFGTPRTVNIPDSSFSNGQGSFQTQLPFPKDQKFLATMSDASGFASGGTSDVLEVGASISNSNCNTTDPGVDFFFQLNSALKQCRTFTFDDYSGAVQPVTIKGIVPGGSSIILNPPVGPTTFEWIADVPAGSSIVFILTDSKGRQGGSSDLNLVGVSDDSTCLTANSPSSVSAAPSATASQSSTSGAPAASSSGGSASGSDKNSSSSGPNGAVVAAAVAAGVVGTLAIGALVIFFVRKRRKERYYRHSRFGSIDLAQDPPPGPYDNPNLPPVNPYTLGSQAGSVAGITPVSASSHNLLGPGSQYSQSDSFDPYTAYAPPSATGGATTHNRNNSEVNSTVTSSTRPGETLMSWEDSSVSSAARRKAAAAGIPLHHTPVSTRFIVHTDLEEVGPQDAHEEVIELPPQYSERRAPLPGVSPASVDTFGTIPPLGSPPPPLPSNSANYSPHS